MEDINEFIDKASPQQMIQLYKTILKKDKEIYKQKKKDNVKQIKQWRGIIRVRALLKFVS